MTITSETFYRAECDAPGCGRTLPRDEDEGATHYPLDDVTRLLANANDELDESWTVVGEQTFCPRHAPGNVECAACDGRGYFRTEHPNPEPKSGKWRFTDCPICGDRGYIVPSDASHDG